MSSLGGAPRDRDWWMDQRRAELRMTWDDVAEAAGIKSRVTLWNVRRGGRMNTTTRVGIEQALRWKAGSLEDIDDGREPTSADQSQPYPAEIYERVIRDDTERRIMAERGANEDYKWRVIRILRENAYDAQRSRDDDAQRRLA